MAKLIATDIAQKAIEYELRAECRIERDPSYELTLAGSRVSRKHALIRRQGGVWVVEDYGSSNGTFLNDAPLSPGIARALISGDCLTIGEWKVTFSEEEEATAAPALQGIPTAVYDLTSKQIIGQSLAGEAPLHDKEASQQPLPIQVIGRDPRCHIVLDHPNVARRHCRIIQTPQGSEIEDLGSRTGTYLNDVRLTQRERLRPNDEIRIGLALFIFRNNTLEYFDQNKTVRLDAIGLSVTVRKAGQPLTLLQNIHCVIEPQQFVAVVGASGAGKSTLLNALTGFRKADKGTVLINGADYYANPELFRASIGYVPQDDIVHRELSVADVLRYGARLRLPPDTDRDEIERLLDATLKELKLSHRKEASVSTLSGGERKRVNVGVELLSRPSLLFLDEPTSGLDPGLELEFIELVRQLTQEGRTIVLITHATSSIAACDRLLFLARGGRIAYYGPPAEALAYFEVDDFAAAYRKVNNEAQTPEFWEQKFQESPLYDRYIRAPEESRPVHRKGQTLHVARSMGATAPRPSTFQQFALLVARTLATLRSDFRNTAFLLAQAPVIALLLMAVFPSDLFTTDATPTRSSVQFQRAPMLLFCIVISALLFGIVNACRELTKERPIYRRERLINLQIWPYILSKVAVLSALSVVQSVLLLALIRCKVDFGVSSVGFLQMLVVVCMANWSGVLLGLLISAVASSNDQAMSLVPIAVLPQIIFSGLIDIDTIAFVSKIMPSYWAYAALGNLTGLKGKEMFTLSPLSACSALAFISLLYLLLCYQRLKIRDKQFG